MATTAPVETSLTRGYSATKPQLQARMKRIEGQVHGVLGMVEDDRYCIVLTQADRTGELIAAVARLLRRG